MTSSLSESPAPRAEPVSHVAVLDWLGELRAAMRTSTFTDLLDFDGIDALDVLLAPLYLAVLNSLRNGDTKGPRHSLPGRVRDWAYYRREAWRQRLAARRTAAVRPADVVLWTRDVTHTVNMEPVVRALRQRGVSCEILACQPKTFNRLRGRDIEAIYAGGAWPQVVRKAREDGIRRTRQLAAVGHWPVPRFGNLLPGRLEQTVRLTVLNQLPYISETIANARAAVDQFGCRLLVVGNDLTMEGRAGCRVAAARGIPSAVFMHGSITSAPRHSHAFHCADLLLVFGESQRRELLRLGIDGEKIVVCGAPSLDGRPRQKGSVHPSIGTRLGLRPGEPWILVATSGPGHSISHAHHEKVIATLVRLSAALGDVPLVVKLHNKDRLAYYRHGLKARAGGRFFVIPYDSPGFPASIFDWLQGCSMVLTGASSVAIEAMLMDVPVITMDYCDEIAGTDFIDAGATTHVRTGQELESAVGSILASGTPDDVHQRVQAYLKDAFFAMDGASASRGAAALCELANIGDPR